MTLYMSWMKSDKLVMALLPPIVVSYKLDTFPKCKPSECEHTHFKPSPFNSLLKASSISTRGKQAFLFKDSFAAVILKLSSSNLPAYLPCSAIRKTLSWIKNWSPDDTFQSLWTESNHLISFVSSRHLAASRHLKAGRQVSGSHNSGTTRQSPLSIHRGLS